ncbi:MAG: hypothetical protein JRH20_32790 [Deltaproteobacteria bacterium]|nr:hypothetical protein [Deltaproteobacteria bacterium]
MAEQPSVEMVGLTLPMKSDKMHLLGVMMRVRQIATTHGITMQGAPPPHTIHGVADNLFVGTTWLGRVQFGQTSCGTEMVIEFVKAVLFGASHGNAQAFIAHLQLALSPHLDSRGVGESCQPIPPPSHWKPHAPKAGPGSEPWWGPHARTGSVELRG